MKLFHGTITPDIALPDLAFVPHAKGIEQTDLSEINKDLNRRRKKRLARLQAAMPILHF